MKMYFLIDLGIEIAKVSPENGGLYDMTWYIEAGMKLFDKSCDLCLWLMTWIT